MRCIQAPSTASAGPSAAPVRRAMKGPSSHRLSRQCSPAWTSQQASRPQVPRIAVSMMSERTESGRDTGSVPFSSYPPAELPSMPPPPPKVQHSSAFLLRDVRSASSAEASVQPPPASASSENLGVVEWALRRADEELTEIERSPTPLARAAWLLGKAAGQVASDPNVQQAAKATARMSAEVVKAVVPLGMSLGKWALQAALPALLAAGEKERGGTVRKKAVPPKGSSGRK